VFVGAPVRAVMLVKKVDKKSKGFFVTCETNCYIQEGNVLATTGEAVALVPTAQFYKLIGGEQNYVSSTSQ
jgi:hypothetical protein